MRLNSLHLTNFRQHVDTHLDFTSGITGIIGPNGSGKSTILEAIAWALYGTPAARGTRDSIRSYRAGPRAVVKVDLEFELGAHRYLVSRGLTNAELYLDGANSPIATSISAVTDVLRRRLGMSHEEFFHTYFTGQKELSVMAAMGPNERGQFLSRVLGYERLRTAQGFARDRRKTLVAEATGLKTGMADPEVVQRSLADAKTRIADSKRKANAAGLRRTAARRATEEMTPRWEAMQRDRERSQTLAAESRVADGEASSTERDIARIDKELGDAATARAELDSAKRELAPLPALETELKELDRSARRGGSQADAHRDGIDAGEGHRAASRARVEDRRHAGARDGSRRLARPDARDARDDSARARVGANRLGPRQAGSGNEAASAHRTDQGRARAARPDRRAGRRRNLPDLRSTARHALPLRARRARQPDRDDHRRRQILSRAHRPTRRDAAGDHRARRTPARADGRSG